MSVLVRRLAAFRSALRSLPGRRTAAFLWVRRARLGCRQRAALSGLRCGAAQGGQSFVELALSIPILLLTVLGIANLSLSIRAQTDLAQITQQAAQYLLYHPLQDSSCNTSLGAYQSCTTNFLAAYLANEGFNASTVGVSFGTTTSGMLDETISVSYPFTLLMPIWSTVSVGALHGNTLNLGARVTTLVATAPPQQVSATRSGLQLTITWNAPQPFLHGQPLANLSYKVYPSGTVIPTPSGAGPYSATITDGSSQTIWLSAVQSNGLESPRSAAVTVQ